MATTKVCPACKKKEEQIAEDMKKGCVRCRYATEKSMGIHCKSCFDNYSFDNYWPEFKPKEDDIPNS